MKKEVKKKAKKKAKSKAVKHDEPKKYKVTAEQLNIRKEASNDGEIINTLKKNEQVQVYSIDEYGWTKVKYKDQFVFVHSKHLEE